MPYRRFNSLSQLALGVASCVALVLLLESGGLLSWATRLELGPERSIALPAALALNRFVAPLHLDTLRHHELLALDYLGWSADFNPRPAATPPQDAAAVITGEGSPTNIVILSEGSQHHRGPQPKDLQLRWPRRDAKPVSIPKPASPLLPLATPPLRSHLPTLVHALPRTIALAGDSMMAVGLSPELLRESARYPQLTLLKAFRSGTGLARPEVFNWLTEYPLLLGPVHPDVVLVALGGNDGQGFVDSGTTYLFGTPQWSALYQRRVQAFLSLLTANGATVVWLGLPPMRSADYDARLALVTRIQYTVVAANPHALWFPTAALVGDTTGRYQDFGTFHGTLARLRQPDGIHLSDDGAALIAAHLLPWLAAKP